jgi:hypothetical protein
LGVLITWQLFGLAKYLFGSKTWLIVKILGLVPLAALWCLAAMTVMSMLSSSLHGPSVTPPPMNWPLVLLGTVPFLLTRLFFRGKQLDLKQQISGVVLSFYSIVMLFVAILGYYGSTTRFGGVLLVVAVQLQYIMSYVVTQTNYLSRSHDFTARLLGPDFAKADDSAGQYVYVAIVGLPFIIPLALVLLISSL